MSLERARQQLDAGDLGAARATLEGMSETERSGALWLYARGTLALRSGEPVQAQAFFEQAVAQEPDLADLRANLGAALLEQVKAGARELLPRAVTELEAAARLPSPLPHVQNNLGMAYLMSGDAAAALACLDRALEAAPGNVPSLYNRAVALHELGRFDECLAALDAVLELDPAFELAKKSRERVLSRRPESR